MNFGAVSPERFIRLALAFATVVVACGLFALWLLNKPATDTLADRVPGDASAYVHVFLKPSTQERLDIEALLENTLGSTDAGASLKDALESLLEPLLNDVGMDYDRDVQPWLGSQAAWFSLGAGTDQAVAIETKDDHAAREVLERLVVSRPDLRVGGSDGVVVVGTTGAVVAFDDPLAVGHGLGAEPVLERTLDGLPSHRVLTAFARSDGGTVALGGSVRLDGIQLDVLGSEGLSLWDVLADVRIGPADLLGSVDPLSEYVDGGLEAALRLTGVIGAPGLGGDDLLGDGFEATSRLGPSAALALAGSLGLLDSQAEADLPGWLVRIEQVVVGSKDGGDRAHTRIFIGVK